MIFEVVKKIWLDPVGSKVISAFIIFIVASIWTLKAGLENVINFFLAYAHIENLFLLGLVALATYGLTFLISKNLFERPKTVAKDLDVLIHEVSDRTISTDALLRKAKHLAVKLKDDDFSTWADSELKGEFPNMLAESLPPYRQIQGELKAFNPYRGWETVQFADAGTREAITYAPNGQDIFSLEELLKREEKGGTLIFPHGPKQRQIIFNFLKDSGSTDFQLVISYADLNRIVTTVRNKIYAWAYEKKNAL